MKQPMVIKGKWFFPGIGEEAATGTLTFEPNKGGHLTFDSVLPMNNKVPGMFIDLLHGITYDGKKIILHQSYISSLTPYWDETDSGVGITSISVNYLLVGNTFPTTLKFDRIRLQFQNLEEWLSVFGFDKVEAPIDNNPVRVNVSYTQPDKINFLINGTIEGEFVFLTSIPSHKYLNRLQITQTSQIVLKTPILTDFNNCFEYIGHFQNLLTLGTFETSYPFSVKFGNSAEKDEVFNRHEEYELFFSNRATLKESSNKQWHEFLFSYRDVQNDFSRLLSKWFSQADKIEPVLNILLESFYTEGQFNENNFLNIAQALETFHRRFREVPKMPKMPKDEHKKVVDDIIVSAPESHKGWLEMKLRFAYEPTLDERLTELLDEVPDQILSAIVADREDFKRKIKQNRNYYTHYGEELTKKALKGGELFYLTERMRTILVMLILLETSFTSKQVIELFERNKHQFFQMILLNVNFSTQEKENQSSASE